MGNKKKEEGALIQNNNVGCVEETSCFPSVRIHPKYQFLMRQTRERCVDWGFFVRQNPPNREDVISGQHTLQPNLLN